MDERQKSLWMIFCGCRSIKKCWWAFVLRLFGDNQGHDEGTFFPHILPKNWEAGQINGYF
ncbi:MAG: hypothetical protein PHS57_10010 [Alphaproteobacteria bacterium]|nr:hypothetical protein [Alphaproteobacteria bacterium]